MEINVPIHVYTMGMEYLGDIDGYQSLAITRRWYGVGDWSLTADASTANIGLLATDRILVPGNAYHKALIVRAMQYTPERGRRTLTYSGPMLDGLTQRRSTVPPTQTEDPAALGWDRVRGTAEEVLRHYANRHMIAPLNPDRAMTGMEIEPVHDPPLGITTPWQTRFEALSEVLYQIGEWTHMGWNIRADPKTRKLIFYIVPGQDRTQGNLGISYVAFGDELHPMQTAEYVEDRSGVTNALYLGGAGEDEERLVLTQYADERYNPVEKPITGLDRIETFVDVGNLDMPDDIEYEGRHKHKTSANPIRSLRGTIAPEGSFVYEQDWDLGDKVTVILREDVAGINVRMDEHITAITEVYERGSRGLDVVFGGERQLIEDRLMILTNQPVR